MTEPDLVHALADGWGIRAAALRYAAVGGGSYHWVVHDDQGERWFVTVDDLDDKGWLGRTRPAVFEGLRAAMDAALTLRREAALGFVVAPVPALDGQTLRPLGATHAVAVFPLLPGAAGRFGEIISAPDRNDLVVMLAALHRVDPKNPKNPKDPKDPENLQKPQNPQNPAAVRLPRCEIGLPWRGDLEAALRELAGPGPAARSPSRPAHCSPEPPGSLGAGWKPWTGGPVARRLRRRP